LAQAGSGTITVNGLNPSTSYTFTVRATNSIGQSAASAASNSITTPALVLGQAFGGGFFAGQISTSANSVPTHNLIVGPLSSAQSGGLQWKTSTTDDPGTNSLIDGPANSASINDGNHPAAQFCESLSIGGFSDWYLPAKNELEVCYFNLKPNTDSNRTGDSGINVNAVPSRGGFYTAGTPARTSVAIFQTGGAEAFPAAGQRWSSTQSSASGAWGQFFDNGFQKANSKTAGSASYNARAIRRVAV
jgi:hypothetical protein